ncbi:MAG: hypothetical protein GY798_24030 [Hyphomicrobiales bacterium]|nr:hypothetical protein [Hyphomicrobiales bacterium]
MSDGNPSRENERKLVGSALEVSLDRLGGRRFDIVAHAHWCRIEFTAAKHRCTAPQVCAY